jgi:hypothetical protein
MSAYEPPTRWTIPDDVVFEVLDDQAVLLNLVGIYFGLNDTGTRIWKLIEARRYRCRAQAHAREFDVSQETLEGDLRGLLSELLERGLLVGGVEGLMRRWSRFRALSRAAQHVHQAVVLLAMAPLLLRWSAFAAVPRSRPAAERQLRNRRVTPHRGPAIARMVAVAAARGFTRSRCLQHSLALVAAAGARSTAICGSACAVLMAAARRARVGGGLWGLLVTPGSSPTFCRLRCRTDPAPNDSFAASVGSGNLAPPLTRDIRDWTRVEPAASQFVKRRRRWCLAIPSSSALLSSKPNSSVSRCAGRSRIQIVLKDPAGASALWEDRRPQLLRQ